jgi:predicted transcriptional regulator
MAIHEDARTSQHKIASKTNLSSSMVNNYIKEFRKTGFIKIAGETNRTQSYHLTRKGEKELLDLLLDYSAEIVRLYGNAKRELAERLKGIHQEGVVSVALFGAAETAEIVYAAVRESGLTVKGIVDSSPQKQGTWFNGFAIQAPEDLSKMEADAVVITSFAKQMEIHDRIREILGPAANIKTLTDF